MCRWIRGPRAGGEYIANGIVQLARVYIYIYIGIIILRPLCAPFLYIFRDAVFDFRVQNAR